MTTERKIRKLIRSRATSEGAGVSLRRAIGFGEPAEFDPFLLLDDFRGDDPAHYLKGFPWHPHRGIETITYMLDGSVEHGDSLGNSGVIRPGDVQWMTAGSGIIHQEMPQGDAGGRMGGFQLWANLPAARKMMGPRYQGFTAAEIPEYTDAAGVRVKVICGAVNGVQGPVQDVVIDPEYLDVTVPPGAVFERPTPRGHTVFAYVFSGEGCFCGECDPYAFHAVGANYFDTERGATVGNGQLVHFTDGDLLTVAASVEPVRFLLVSGRPIGEPIAWYGPIVMNSQEELRVAYDELNRGTFIKKTSPPNPLP